MNTQTKKKRPGRPPGSPNKGPKKEARGSVNLNLRVRPESRDTYMAAIDSQNLKAGRVMETICEHIHTLLPVILPLLPQDARKL